MIIRSSVRLGATHTKRVRDLAGYTTDLKNLLTERDPSVSIFLFDEYLKKAL